MKKVFTILLLTIFINGLPYNIYAATPTASAAAQKQLNAKVDDLKERLATRVAQLRQSSPKALYGTVTQVTLSSITVETQSKTYKIELTDDINVFQMIRGKRTALTTEDIDKNDMVSVFGDYDSTIDMIKASTIFIEAATKPTRIHGTITEVNKTKNTISVKGMDEQQYTVDVETTTRTNTWTVEKGIERSGFSKLAAGQFISVLGTPDKENDTVLAGIRILHVSMPGKPSPTAVITPTSTASATIKPSTTPKNTPKPTAKATPTTAPN